MPSAINSFEFLQRRLRAGRPTLDVPSDPAAVPGWQKAAAERLAEILGIGNSRPVPLAPRTVKIGRRDGYELLHVVFSSEEDVEVPGLLLIPDGVSLQNPAPGVLCLHGGVPGAKDELAGEAANPRVMEGLARYHDDYARQLAQQGFVALAIDLRTFGERAHQSEDDIFGLNATAGRALAANVLFLGQTYFGLQLFDAMRALDYLQSRPDVTAEAIGCAGFSLGGNLAGWLAAIDRRVRVAALEGQWASWRRLLARDLEIDRYRHNGQPWHLLPRLTYQLLPGFLRDLDMNLSIAAVAPTPLVVAYEYETWQFEDLDEAKRDTEPMRRAYAGFGATDNLKLEYVRGPHMWRREVLVPWFTERLWNLVS